MIRAIKAVSSERGRDPRQFALVGFGGNGPLFSAVMAETLMIGKVLIPPSAGVFSSFGLLYSDVEYHFTRTRKSLLSELDPGSLDAILLALEGEARGRLSEDGFGAEQIEISRSAALHYQGQSFELEVAIPAGKLDWAKLVALEEAYGVEHEKTYGHRASSGEPVELVTLKVIGRGIPETSRAALAGRAELPKRLEIAKPVRKAYFGPKHGWVDTRVVNRADLSREHRGPCIVEEYDSTCVVPPGWTARLDRYGNIGIEQTGPPRASGVNA
jgi:N-methylhydantoinase A